MSNKMLLYLKSPHSNQQKILFDFFMQDEIKELIMACGSKFGKCLNILEKIPTPEGWKTMAELKEGDYVFDENGKPTKIIFKTDTMYNHNCYRVHFSDGNTVDCDEEHLWLTTTHYERKNIARAKNPNDRCKSTNAKPRIRTTKEILETIEIEYGGKKRPNHAIPLVTNPLEFNGDSELLVDPYILGCWLSDGTKNTGFYSKTDEFILNEIKKHYPKVTKVTYTDHYINGIITDLKKLGVNEKKIIPEEYLISSIENRISLLQGLMDGDGTISKRGDCTFDNTNKKLADGVEALCVSLGIKCTRSGRFGKLNGEIKKWCYRVHFTTDKKVFRTPKKLERIREINVKAKRRYIVKVEPIPSQPVQCIRVDNPTHLFLAGNGCVPTHNTFGAACGLSQALWVRKNRKMRWVAPIYEQAKIGLEEIKNILPGKPHTDTNLGSLKFTVPRQNNQLKFWHGREATSLEGGAIDDYVFDEAAKMKEDVYTSAYTTTTRTLGKFAIISTPYGKNWFYRKAMEARDEMEDCLAKGKMPSKIFITAPTSANPTIPRHRIEEAKRNLPTRLYDQYHRALFIDEGTTFINYMTCIFGKKLELFGDRQWWFEENCKAKTVVIGADWGKKKDYNVFTAIDYTNGIPIVVGFLRFHHTAYTAAVKELYRFCQQFNSVTLIYHDATGIGDVINDLLDNFPYPYEPIVFTNNSKSAMVNLLATSFEQNKIIIPNWEILIKELEVYECKVNSLGLMIFNAPSGFHDDSVCSLMLANAAAQEYVFNDIVVHDLSIKEDTKTENKDINFNTWYNKLVEDEDDYLDYEIAI